MSGILIKGGTVVDGTKAPAFQADVRVRDGIIAEVGPGLTPTPGERIVDAAGCYVTPGFIEAHTHYDATIWWQAELDPLPGYGVTTAVIGNCGFGAAPVHDDMAVRLEMVKIFTFFEEIPSKPFLTDLPWDWKTWPEYRRSMEKRVKTSVNLAAFVGHIPLRLAVMGMDAWNRAATEGEIREMARQLEEAVQAGALGLSSNFMDHDSEDRPVPSLMADDAELTALMEVLSRYPNTSFQLILDTFFHMENAPKTMERIATLSEGMPVRVQFVGAGALINFQSRIRDDMWRLIEKYRAEGRDFWPSYSHVPVTTVLNFFTSSSFAQANDYVWHEVILTPTVEGKLALLNDPAWRERARDSWDNKAFKQSLVCNPHQLQLLQSETGAGPLGITLKDLAEQTGQHPSDALADWVIANGVDSIVHREPHPMSEELTLRMIQDEQTVGGLSDAGAHGQMLCGGGENILYFTEMVRDRGLLSIEEAVYVQTGKMADYFNFDDRGIIRVGARADIAVFNLAEVERRPMHRIYDVPTGEERKSWRFTRDAAPMRLTLVAGEPTFENGAFTGVLPGRMISPGAPLALAAE
jgi:N-acyl-D-aspartate/D-glutamate deacylase